MQTGTMFNGEWDKALLFSADAGQCLTQAGTMFYCLVQTGTMFNSDWDKLSWRLTV